MGAANAIIIPSAAEIFLSKDLTLLKIQANQNDPIIFQTFFCVHCREFFPANGLFPAPEAQCAGHALAWLPAVDEPTPGQPAPALKRWLQSAPLDDERRRYLTQIAASSNSLVWALMLEIDERPAWFDFFADYLDGLADCWLAGLNGLDSVYFRAKQIWRTPRPACRFSWRSEN